MRAEQEEQLLAPALCNEVPNIPRHWWETGSLLSGADVSEELERLSAFWIQGQDEGRVRYCAGGSIFDFVYWEINSLVYGSLNMCPRSKDLSPLIFMLLQFLQDILDTLFVILDDNTEKYGLLVFQSLVSLTLPDFY